ncbi:hypothetical protein [Halomicrobium salinisoli]|uniref:hypothetical protein n=1 Tax=Halomicrobium salinisoli TaxID=2878391 RepID=UPI001CEFF83F|nr:hypothetical protein [Halomicrobium salinisoli]
MLPDIVLRYGSYLLACTIALGLHELAHYAVDSRYAESVTVGVNRYGPYVDAYFDSSVSPLVIRLGAVAPTLLYTPFIVLSIVSYLQMYPIPDLDLVEWSLVVTPLVLLAAPTGPDIYAFLNASE